MSLTRIVCRFRGHKWRWTGERRKFVPGPNYTTTNPWEYAEHCTRCDLTRWVWARPREDDDEEAVK